MVKNLIFDLGNVIIDQKTVSADFYFANILNISKKEAKEFYKSYRKQAVSGLISFDFLSSLFIERFNSKKSVKEIIQEYQSLYIKDVKRINTELIDLIKHYSHKYNVFIMTNTLSPHYYHWKAFKLDKYFKRVFRSDIDHFIKPEAKAYEFVLKEIKAKPEECVFIDDLEENIEGAVSIGMKGIVYNNNNQLRRDLDKIRVII